MDNFLSKEKIGNQDLLALFSMADLIESGPAEYRKYTNINPGGFYYLLSSLKTLKADFTSPNGERLLDNNTRIEKVRYDVEGLRFKK